MSETLNWAYFGPPGTFTHEAAQALVRDRASLSLTDVPTLVPYRSIPDVLAAVQADAARCGVVPIENSTEGSVNVTLDALAHDVALYVRAEHILPIRHHLLVQPGTHRQQIEAVFSHPQALAQCRKSLERLIPDARVMAATSTAEAAEKVAGGGGNVAALGTSAAAAIYNLDVLVQDLQDFDANATRFVLVGRKSPEPTGHDKTSVVFAFDSDKPGNLYRALQAFANHEVNLTKLESRPAKRTLGDYIFFVDMEGHMKDEHVEAALRFVQSQCGFFKWLGSYPRVDFPRPNGNSL